MTATESHVTTADRPGLFKCDVMIKGSGDHIVSIVAIGIENRATITVGEHVTRNDGDQEIEFVAPKTEIVVGRVIESEDDREIVGALVTETAVDHEKESRQGTEIEEALEIEKTKSVDTTGGLMLNLLLYFVVSRLIFITCSVRLGKRAFLFNDQLSRQNFPAHIKANEND